jgi:hypothetical protein
MISVSESFYYYVYNHQLYESLKKIRSSDDSYNRRKRLPICFASKKMICLYIEEFNNNEELTASNSNILY